VRHLVTLYRTMNWQVPSNIATCSKRYFVAVSTAAAYFGFILIKASSSWSNRKNM